MKKITVNGGTGFVGAALVSSLLKRGDEVTVLTRDRARAAASWRGPMSPIFVEWKLDDEARGPVPGIDGADAVVQLAGEVLVGRRLTAALETEARRSRVDSTRALVQSMRLAAHPPRTFVSGSAVGHYGSQPPDRLLDESSPAGSDFFSRLCVDWEEAALAAPEGVRVVVARLGIVFGKDGGALPMMARPFHFFAGGKIGDGKQVVSWIHLKDVVRALSFCVDEPTLSGPVNVCAPEPESNARLAQLIGATLERPAWLPAPSFALRALFGREGAAPILEGQRVMPRRLLDAGFQFDFPNAEAALRDALRRS
jgi:uncharacterized protein (TIGR01777 family)